MPAKKLADVVALCKRRNLIAPSSEIYGGLASTFDYGHLGTLLKQNVKAEWWRSMLRERTDIRANDAAILMDTKVWEASGHLELFVDEIVQCHRCAKRFRLDHLPVGTSACPVCAGSLSEPVPFNLMFPTHLGPVEETASRVYLRPETAQGIFTNFVHQWEAGRARVPFGVAQIGKSFRNEITPGNFIFRTREFEQMEMEYFCEPERSMEVFAQWRAARYEWWIRMGIRAENLILRDHDASELAHYSAATSDIEYRFAELGFSELEGVAHRGDYDLTAHQNASGKDLRYQDPHSGKKYLPHVVEPAAGCDRAVLAFLCEAYRVEKLDERATDDERVVLSLHPRLAPNACAVMSISKKAGLPDEASAIHRALSQELQCDLDAQGKIGTAYRRQDEIGTPYCIAVDHQTLEDGTVTIRERDSTQQVRISKESLLSEILSRRASPWSLPPER